MTRLLALLFLLPAAALAEPARVLKVQDGDTVTFEMAGQRVGVRVSGIDSPETHRAKCERERALGLQAKMEAQRLLPRGSMVEVVRANGRDKFGRTLARITLPDGRDYSSILLQLGLARKYNGGRKESWCQ